MTTVLLYINSLLFLSIAISIIYFIKNNRALKTVRRYIKTLFFILFMSLIYKLPIDFSFFYGLEYEDSYLANSVSRFLTYNSNNLEPSFLAQSCGIGSLSNCTIGYTHSGNLIGLPSLIWMANFLFGYHAIHINFLNLLFSITTAVCVFFIGYKISKEYLLGLISSIVFITTPILSSFHTSSLFETSSSCLIVISFLLFIVYFDTKTENRQRLLLFSLMILINILSIHFKRENIIILSFPFIMIGINFIKFKWRVFSHLREMSYYIIFLLGLVLYYFFVLKISLSLEVERDLALGNSFQLKFFPALLGMFFKGFSNFSWFSIYSLFAIFGVVYILKNIKAKSMLLFPLILMLTFLVLNSLHHRNYYFSRSGFVSDFESLRHINMMSPFFALVSGCGLFMFYKMIKKIKILRIVWKRAKYSGFLIIFLFFGYLLYSTYSLRNDLISKERSDRIDPINSVLDVINIKDDIVITDQSILMHNYCSENLLIIDFSIIGKKVLSRDLLNFLSDKNIYFLWKDYYEEYLFKNRYKDAFNVLDKFEFETVMNGDRFAVKKLVRSKN